MSETIVTVDGTVFTMKRELNAPLDRVWEAWADPDILAKWWGPRGWETTIKSFDFTENGVWHYCMKCVDEKQGEWFGQESWGKATFKSIQPKNKFVYLDEFSDAEGNSNAEMPAIEIHMTFEETPDGKTVVTSASDFGSPEALKKVMEMGMEQGAKETWDRLAETVEKA
jgi:uncharacterized protein YndB with AHSA1/START domain